MISFNKVFRHSALFFIIISLFFTGVAKAATGSINIGDVWPDGGFGYFYAQDFGTPADSITNGDISILHIFENGVELSPAHSPHASVRNTGLGRFSHWGDAGSTALYFSASDNTDPRSNGRSYTYSFAEAGNTAPSANAGSDQSITLPTSSVSLSGSATDPEGNNMTYAWTKVSGGSATITSPSSLSTTITGLSQGTYIFWLTATDSGGLSNADAVTVTVNAAQGGGDTTAPTTPTSLSGTATSTTQINLTWSASTDAVGVTGYKIYRNGTQVATSTTNSYSNTGLTASTAYSFTVSAYDAAGNNSAQSSAVSVSTQSGGGGNTYYVATNGNDNNAGTISAPFKNWEKLEEVMVAGDTAYIRGGTYSSPRPASDEIRVWWQNLHGTASNPIRIWAYPGEKPVLDFTGQVFSTPGVYGLYLQYSEYVHLKGLRVTGLAQNPNGNSVNVFVLDRANNNTVELMELDHSGGSGVVLLHANDNLILNVDSHHLGDGYSAGYAWGGTNGFAVTGDVNTSTRNTFRGCRAWAVSDNGWAIYATSGIVTIENSWAFRVGWRDGGTLAGGDGVGFKLGRGNGQTYSITRTLRNNLAFENRFQGFDENFQSDNQYVAQLDNNTAYNNGLGNITSGGYPYISGYNFNFFQNNRTNILRNNLGYVSENNALINSQSIQNTNSWNGGVTVSDADFLSLSSVGMDGPRQSDGSLPVTNFLKLASNSDLINTGTNVGLPYTGSAPDIGAFESSGTTPPADTTAPTTPTSLSGTATSTTQINLTWSASTDAVGVTGYKIYRNGTQVATSTTNSYSNTGLTASTAYSFTVSAYDAAGNNSAQSSAVSVSTQAQSGGNTYYLSPTGSDNNSGAISSPWFSLNKAWTVIAPGDTVYLRGGTYAYTAQIQGYLIGKNGTSTNLIKVWAYPGETPVITRTSSYQNNQQHWRGGVYFSGNYFHWKGINFTGFKHFSGESSPFIWRGLYIDASSYNTFELLNSYSNELGISIDGDSFGNLVLNCDVHHNWDIGANGGNADGIQLSYQMTGGGAPNILRGVRSWWNGDDGFDFWENSNGAIIENSWSWYNGYYPDTFNPAGNGEGYKLGQTRSLSGTVLRTLKNTIAYKNRNRGYDQNNADLIVQMYNNTSFANGGAGIALDLNSNAHVFKNNVSFGNGNTGNVYITSQSSSQTNSYDSGNAYPGWTVNASAADFVNTIDPSGLDDARQADGSLPNITFLQLASNSDLINTGTNVGLPYTGSAPDIGAFESSGTTPPADTTAPTTPTSLSGTATSTTQINLTWSASTDAVGVTGYKIYRNGTQVATSTTNSYSNTGLTASTAYSFTVSAYDAAGNNSAQSSAVSVSTQASGTPKFIIGDRVYVNTTALNVRATASTSGALLGNQQQGFLGTVTGGSTVANGYTWWNINYDTAPDGWSVETYLEKYTVPPPTNLVNISGTVSDGGFGYFVSQDFGTPTDVTIGATTSLLRIFENGTELLPAHTLHATIRSQGQGRFSHWGDGASSGLYFSASDNSDPRTNGRTYTYSIASVANTAPTANAGVDQSITLPTSSLTLSGSGTDTNGSISSYAWSKVSGGTANISSASSASTTITSLTYGTYVFRLTVTDNGGLTAIDDVQVIVNGPAFNVSAGADQAITLPVSSISVFGSVSGGATAASYAWSKVSGGTANISSASSASTTITSLAQGSYVFQLTVTDTLGRIGSDTMAVNVSGAVPPPNVIPTANAGTDKSITLPTSSVTLTGSGTDSDGTISSYSWTKISGTGGTITSPSSATTTITGLSQGTYTYRLTVTDNQGGVGTDDTVVTVNAAPNVAPTANAGIDKVITLPTSSVTLTGSGTDSDGTISSYSWTKISGTGGSIVSATSASTNITGLTQGSYMFRLTVTDNGGLTGIDDVLVTVNPAPNVPPTANAGADKSITLPTNSTSFAGSGTDSDGTISSYSWTKISGTGGTITSPSSATTTITGLSQGTYTYRLTVTDNQGATGTDDVLVTVAAGIVNTPPVVTSGVNQTITLPTNFVTLSGSASDPGGSISSYAWSKVSGGTATIVSPSSTTTNITGLSQGTYTFRLTATDNGGLTGYDDVLVTVNAAPNVAPTANAGIDKVITLPTSSVTLTGSGTDSDGTISSYSWTNISGTGGSIVSATSASTNITGLTQGSYMFRLTVTDNGGLTGYDEVVVTVNSAVVNIPPVANAGVDKVISLPTSSLTLIGSATDSDGTISSYSWTKISGTGGSIVSATSASTNITGLTQGSYTFRLTATDNGGLTGYDEVAVTVNAIVTIGLPPVVSAGADQVTTSRVVTLTATATDPQNEAMVYLWKQDSGPSISTLSSTTALSTTISNLVAGTYVFSFAATDVGLLTASDTVSIIIQSVQTFGGGGGGGGGGNPNPNPTPTPTPTPTTTIASVTTKTLNVRSSPSATSAIVGKVSKGMTGTVIQTVTGWTKVQFTNGLNGWVTNSYIKVTTSSTTITPTPSPTTTTVTVTAQTLNVRQSASTTSAIVGKVYRGTVGTKIAGTDTNGWVKVQFTNTLSGYVNKVYLK